MKRGANAWGVLARIGALLVTTVLLAATSAPLPDGFCGEWTAPVTFRAAGTCGPGGIIVVDSRSGYIQIYDGAALGLPPLVALGAAAMQPYVHDTALACPRVYERGGWEVVFPECRAVGDGSGVPAAGGENGGRGPAGGDAGMNDGGGLGGGGGGASGRDGGGATGGASGGGVTCVSRCQAMVASNGQLVFKCLSLSGQSSCESRLTPVP